ncbi:MAG: metallophosphoesterase family protein [Bacteroidota bacterium]
MLHIGLLSDTHGYLHPRVLDFFGKVDEIWHAGDIGDLSVAEQLAGIKLLRAVYGNIDGQDIRLEYPKDLLFTVEKVKALMTHIGGYPGKYDPRIRLLIEKERPKLFVCGHSHILKVIYDKRYDLLHVNPGAAGKYGLHRSITAVRLVLDGGNMRDLEVLELEKNQELGIRNEL